MAAGPVHVSPPWTGTLSCASAVVCVCLCVYVCMCVCVCLYVHMYVHACVCVCVRMSNCHPKKRLAAVCFAKLICSCRAWHLCKILTGAGAISKRGIGLPQRSCVHLKASRRRLRCRVRCGEESPRWYKYKQQDVLKASESTDPQKRESLYQKSLFTWRWHIRA